MTMRRLLAVTAIATTAAVGLAACGGGDSIDASPVEDPVEERSEKPETETETESGTGTGTGTSGDPIQRLRLAEDKTSEQASAAVDITMDIDVDGESIGVDMDGIADLSTGAADFTMGLEGPGISSELRLLTDTTTVWVSDDGSTWYEISASEFASGSGTPANLDASGYLAFLDQVGEVSEVGPQEIDGVDTTQYHAEIDIADFAELQGAGVDAATLEQAGIETMPLDVYIDGDDFVRRVTLSMEADIDGTSFSMDIAADYSDFGTTTSIETPPSGEILPGSSATVGELIAGS